MQYKSIANWPPGTCSFCFDRTEDTHDTQEQAQGACNRLAKQGFAGDGKIFPLKTEVKPVLLTKEELAARLNGREYGDEITKEEERLAKESGLVVVFGYSDDNTEFRGCIYDEVGGCGTHGIKVSRDGVIPRMDEDEEEVLAKFGVLEAWRQKGRVIKAIWGGPDYSWQYETAIPHATFEIVEGDEKYCKGIVFNLSDIAK